MRNLRRLYFKNRKGRRNCFASRSVRKLEGKYNDTSAVSWYHIFTMNDDVVKDQLPKNKDTKYTQASVDSVGSTGNKEAGPIASETKDLITPTEKGPEVSPELVEMGVVSVPHPSQEVVRISDTPLSPMVVSSTQTAILNTPMTEVQAFVAERTPDKNLSFAWLGGVIRRAFKKLSLKPKT